MYKLLLIGVGGAVGSILRFVAATWCQRMAGQSFPVGTLIVNVTGCLAIGFLVAMFMEPTAIKEEYRTALIVGVLGGYTTFSAYGYESFALIKDGHWGRLIAYVLLTNALGLIAVWIGFRAGRA